MWSAVAPPDSDNPAPSSRSKHSATLIGDHVYLLGGRNGNLPLKDFWKYNLVTGRWHQLKPSGDKLPCLQEHSAIAYKDNLYVFGGEVGFSAGTETPLWLYDIKLDCWKKIRPKKGVACPRGRRGHSALVHKGSMIVYGGYQDLRGSCSELWAFHFETESWHLVSSSPTKGSGDTFPAPRHKHSAIIHDDAMWIYGGMTDLQERSDLWKWDSRSRTWSTIKTKVSPGPLHSHAVCRLPSSMIIFGGERNGHPTNELWKFNFSVEMWEKIVTPGLKPAPRAETIAFTVSELLLNDPSANSLESKSVRIRLRTCNSADRGSRHSSYLPNNRVAPSEKTYVFHPTQNNYIDGSDLAEQYSDNRASRSFLQEISKLSQLNIPRINNKCSYSVLAGCTDSTESLLRQHASPQSGENELNMEIATSTPCRGTMIKSKSAYVIKKQDSLTTPDGIKDCTNKKKVEFDNSVIRITREPISVPNFSSITLPTPVLTPVEATKLVYLDTDDENELENDISNTDCILGIKPVDTTYETFKSVKRGESYSSHLGYADNPLYEHMINCNSTKIPTNVSEHTEENVSSTSDYASIETVNRLSSASNYSVKTSTPQEENMRNKERDRNGPFGFCNPNYMGPDLKNLVNGETIDRKTVVRVLNNQDITNYANSEEDLLELQNCDEIINRNTKVLYRHQSSRITRPPKSLPLDKTSRSKEFKCRAHSAGGTDRSFRVDKKINNGALDPFVPLHVYIIGGKEQGQVTVFQRPISIWKLKLF